MLFDQKSVIPDPAGQDEYVATVLAYLNDAIRQTPQEILDQVLGRHCDVRTLGVVGLHHVAVYIGDYESEEQFASLLHTVLDTPGIENVATGPSHIAPRFYGTPGHWVNFRFGGNEYELFTCRQYGTWTTLPEREKATLMSHAGLAIDTAARVKPTLDYLAATIPDVELLAFAPADDLGHTYGHLLNTRTNRVVELVYSAAED
ncbi:MAG: hypothetical protein ACRDTA_29920 [Pseudonocardiaceae bacterium]